MEVQASSSEWLNKVNLYAEYVRVLDYLRDPAIPRTPRHDWTVGIAYQRNRY
ncbi:MAG TPA: hypothetical protein VNA25_20745 [Phycisphaerae bacterium]|nr:hypothetical protein [Phycisphaerae bacterium]